jgi:hypothetical protein
MAQMTHFTPAPCFSEEWWQDLDLSEVDPYTATDEFEATVNADTLGGLCPLDRRVFGPAERVHPLVPDCDRPLALAPLGRPGDQCDRRPWPPH